jgi:hypothetical protein
MLKIVLKSENLTVLRLLLLPSLQFVQRCFSFLLRGISALPKGLFSLQEGYKYTLEAVSFEKKFHRNFARGGVPGTDRFNLYHTNAHRARREVGIQDRSSFPYSSQPVQFSRGASAGDSTPIRTSYYRTGSALPLLGEFQSFYDLVARVLEVCITRLEFLRCYLGGSMKKIRIRGSKPGTFIILKPKYEKEDFEKNPLLSETPHSRLIARNNFLYDMLPGVQVTLKLADDGPFGKGRNS